MSSAYNANLQMKLVLIKNRYSELLKLSRSYTKHMTMTKETIKIELS